ncbi:MAG: peptidoglycan -binding protein [Rhodoferax sp.]|nr:peptidoglycan -binding protein [Pseudorhodobacter sp.]
MALGKRRRDSSMIWPGFVDAVTTILMVLMFVLTIFTVMQSVLRDTITTQDTELNSLTDQLSGLADALGLEQKRTRDLQAEVGQQSSVIATLTGQIVAREGELASATARITSFEAQVAGLLADRDAARGEIADLETAQTKLLSDKEALDLALATARGEIDAGAEAARLAAARREALEALLVDLRMKSAKTEADLQAKTVLLTQEEAARAVDQAAADALRAKLAGADTELTAMTLALEEQRKRAEETLTLLAAAQTDAAKAVTGKDALLETAKAALAAQEAQSAKDARAVVLLNEQVAALRTQLGGLQTILDVSAAKDAASKVQLQALGTQLNSALAQVASEQRRRADLEEAERLRLEEEAKSLTAEAQNLAKFRSEFFGQLSRVLAGREGVRVVGDRFVFSSEVLFSAGAADLAPEGRAQIAKVAATLKEVAGQIPDSIDWIIRVDGHTDNVPLSGLGQFKDNWELSQARALSVVRYMQDDLGFPPSRMAATGFGEWRPVAVGDSPDALAQNRRIELKLTER